MNLSQYFPLILIVLVFVVMILLPARQRKRMQAQTQQLQNSLQIGTPVMTTSGMHATVAGLGEKTVDLEISPGVVVTFLRQAIMEVRQPAGGVPGGLGGEPTDGTSGPTDSTH